MKQNKKIVLIAVIAFLVIAAALAAILLIPRKLDYTFPPFSSQYEERKNYVSQDSQITFDGVLDEEIWKNRRWLDVGHISEEHIGVKMTSYFGEDGLYIAFDVNDYGVYYNKYRYIDYNSGLQLYLSPLNGAKDITNCGYEISLNAGEKVGVKQFDGNRFEDYLGRVYMESQIKGDINTPEATGYTIEAYIDYTILGEDCEAIFAYPAIVHTTSATESERQWYSFGLNEKGVSWTRADTWWSFDQQGLIGHQVTFQTENGTVQGNDFVPNGDDYTFTMAPQAGYYAESVLVNGEDVSSKMYYSEGNTLCTMERVTAPLDIQVCYAPMPEAVMDLSGTVTDAEGNPLYAQVWAVAGGYSQLLNVDGQGNFSGTVPALDGMELFAAAEGYVPVEIVSQAGNNKIQLAKMYFGNNENVVRNGTDIALWDLTRMYQGRIRMISTEFAMQLVHSQIYSDNIFASAKLFTDVEQGMDSRAGFTFYVNEELSVFVALTVHGEVNEFNPEGDLGCSVQVIAEQGGERIWGNGGIIVPIENPQRIMELAKTKGVPFAVHYNRGAFDIWVDDQQIGYGVYPKNENGENRLQDNDAVAIGLETWSSRAVFEELKLDGDYDVIRQLSAPGWDLSRLESGIAKSESIAGNVAMLDEDYYGKLCVTGKLPLLLKNGDDIRAGVVLRNKDGAEVFVALTAHGKSHYSVQVISGGWASWKVSGQIADISTWNELLELAKSGGIPFTVYSENGKLTIGLNGYLVAENIVALNNDGNAVLGDNTDLAPGLATPGTTMTITGIQVTQNRPVLKDSVERLWDISKKNSGIYTSKTDGEWASLWLNDAYSGKVSVTANLPLKLQSGDDIRAGVVLRNKQGIEVFVALTAHGNSHYSVQVISGGWASWAVSGKIEDLSTWNELTTLDSIPLAVYVEDGKLTIGINGYVIASGIVPLDGNGNAILGGGFQVQPGIATAGTSLTFTNVSVGLVKPALKDPVERLWDISKASEGTYTSLTDWATIWLRDSFSDKVTVSSMIPLKLQEGDDIRAGVTLRNAQGKEVFVALTAHGLSHYSVQVISGGWVSWAISGQIEDLSTWSELLTLDSIPFVVYAENGKLTIGINGFVIADGIVPLDGEGNPVLGDNANVQTGLSVADTPITFTQVVLDSEKPLLKLPIERVWDISKAEEGIYTSLTAGPWACYWLSESYTDKIAFSANLPLKLQEGDDVRAGITLRNEQGIEVFVALTAHGNSHYSVQVISGGWASWAVEGKISDLSTWSELTTMDSIPLTVYAENGKLTIGINGYVIAENIVPLNVMGNPTFGSNTNLKPGLSTAGTQLQFTNVAIGAEKPLLKQKLHADKGGTIVIPGDFTASNYAVLELNIKALDEITYDWNSNILLSPTGEVWDAYDFQMVYGTYSGQNLVKLTGPGGTVDGISVPQEQWVNDVNFEKVFRENGMNIKLIRMNTWAYLLVDMGSGYTVVGKMFIPAEQATNFSVWNNSTASEITDFRVLTGEKAAFEAFNGLDLTLDSGGMVLPATDDSWTLEGRLVIDTATFPWGTGEYRMYAGADGWGQAVSVYYNKANWYLQNHTNWANVQLPDEQWWKLSAESGGMWVRFQKNGNVLTVSVSADGANWTSTLQHTGATAKGIYLIVTLASQLRNVKLTIGS